MASSVDQQQHHNPAPPFSSAGGHEMRDYHVAQDAPRPPSQEEPYLTPYLGLRARLSQTWINRWTILLLLVLVRTLFAIASLDHDLGSARKQALSMCTSVENVGSAMASMPHYMSQGVNELTAQGIEKAINGLMQTLILMVSAVEDIVIFIINMMTQTYLCLITFAVGGSLHAAISIAEDVGSFLNSTAKGIGDDLGSAADDFQNAMNSFLSDLDKIGSFFTGNSPSPPKIDLTSEINKLHSLQLPSNYDAELQKLNQNIPGFKAVNNVTQQALHLPFEEVKKLLNEALPRYTMDRSLFPVPEKKSLAFCTGNNGINDFFEELVNIEHLAKKIFLVVLVILAALAMVPMAWREMKRWKFMKERARLVKSDAFDSMDAVYLASRPYTSTAGLKLASKFKSRRRQNLVRWSVAYATTVPALFVLSLGIAGLLGCGCQYILLKAIEKEVPKLENQVINFADTVISELDDSSRQWAIGTNHIITNTSASINHDVFGWVNTTTTAINDTLDTFVDETKSTIKDFFHDTVLEKPVLDVVKCLILPKIQGIEKGLTWVSDHAHVDFPLIPDNTFSLGTIAKVSGSSADILATGPNGGAADAITAAVLDLTEFIAAGIRQEAIISACVVLIWVLIALIGIFRALFLMYKGGDDGTWRPTQSATAGSPVVKGTELHDYLPRVPTYEQATQERSFEQGPVNNANRYQGQTYTLTAQPQPPVPIFGFDNATSPIFHTGFSPREEKLGNVNGQFVDAAIRRPTHLRASSYGNYEVTSPEIQYNSTNLQSTTENPFADPSRLAPKS